MGILGTAQTCLANPTKDAGPTKFIWLGSGLVFRLDITGYYIKRRIIVPWWVKLLFCYHSFKQ